MTLGQIVMGIGGVLLATAFVMMIVIMATASGARRKIQQRMKEKY